MSDDRKSTLLLVNLIHEKIKYSFVSEPIGFLLKLITELERSSSNSLSFLWSVECGDCGVWTGTRRRECDDEEEAGKKPNVK